LARLCVPLVLILGLGGFAVAPRAEEPPATPQAPQQAPQQAPGGGLPADARLVTDPAELSALLADRTVHAVYWPEGEPWREFSAADGRTILEAQGCLRPGTWRISGSVVCYTYPSWDEGRPQCFLVYRSPAATHFVFLDRLFGGRHLSSNAHAILEGNPEGLPIDLTTETCRDLNV
jgi:hypothetical protein